MVLKIKYCAQRGARTHDPEIKSLMLYCSFLWINQRWLVYLTVCHNRVVSRTGWGCGVVVVWWYLSAQSNIDSPGRQFIVSLILIIFPGEGGSCRQDTSLHSSDPITRLRIRKHINDDDDDGAMMGDGLCLIKLFAWMLSPIQSGDFCIYSAF